jgi:putative DNA primase/helicase
VIDWDGPSRQPCPDCGRGPKDRTCGVTLDDRGGVAHCFRCGYRETTRGERRAGRPIAPRSAPQRHETLSDFGRELWRACRPLGGDALAYLEARCCAIPPADADLRWHPALKHPPSGLVGPALVGLVTDALTGAPLTLHRTWVRADGCKAPMDPPRMLLGGHRKQGGVIRLWPDEGMTTGLGIAEGIETALSLAHAMAPVWACIDAGNLAAFPVLDGIEALTIAADNDEAGIAAARACARRWAHAGREVRIVIPNANKSDLNDMARAA